SILSKLHPDLIIHCAGNSSVANSVLEPLADFKNSSLVTFDLLERIRLHSPASRFVFLSSAAVYGDPASLPIKETAPLQPISPYGFHKWQCELICNEFSRVYKLRTSFVRIFSAYGPGLKRQVLWDLQKKLQQSVATPLQGTGEESRDFIHVLDICEAIRILFERAPMEGEGYNLATGTETPIRELARLMISLGPNFGKNPAFDGIVPRGVPRNWRADISKIRALGFKPAVMLADGLRDYLNWCRRLPVG
ncbi:MAG: GDP-mannose 4,6-dehydratase, partial [Pirellulales bacterium]